MSPIFEMLVGVAGSGKSTFAIKEKKIIEQMTNNECVICSSDAIRGELWGDESDQREPNKVFQVMLERTRKALYEGKSVIYDAANIEEKYRLQILQQISNFKCFKSCVVFIEKPETCIARQELRERKVPERVIWRQIKKFQTPHYCEGWQNIRVFCASLTYDEMNDEIDKIIGFDQHNPHHKLTLEEHMKSAWRHAVDKKYSTFVQYAALLHDFGKVYTQFFDEKGIAHYYNHENVSAYYYFLLTGQTDEEAIEISWLISHHMDFFKGEKYMAKLKDRIVEELYIELQQLNECDLEAH